VNGLTYVLAFELEARVAVQMGEIGFFAGNEIVEPKNVVTFR
jgi:hypothetical protein